MNIGLWSRLTTEEVIARHTEDWDRIRAGEDLPRGGWETMAQFHERVLHGTELLTEKHSGERVAVVTHGGPIRAAGTKQMGFPKGRSGSSSLWSTTGFKPRGRYNLIAEKGRRMT